MSGHAPTFCRCADGACIVFEGIVNSWVDLSGIHPRTDDGGANGIAYDKSSDTLIVTGKHWNKMFKIEAVLAQ